MISREVLEVEERLSSFKSESKGFRWNGQN
jgi:hypothetical protein